MRNKGFTLIELVITVLIIAILTSIAYSAYQDYTIRSQVSEGLSLASGAKVAVTDTFSNNGSFPLSNAEAGLPSPASITGNYVTSVDTAGGKITVTYGGQANAAVIGSFLVLSASSQVGSVVWHCNSLTIQAKYLPTECR